MRQVNDEDVSGLARVIHAVLRALRQQHARFQTAPKSVQMAAWRRAVYVASLTINASWAVTWHHFVNRQKHPMAAARRFEQKYRQLDPCRIGWKWVQKANFAKALCGASLASDGVCVDRHLQRSQKRPANALEQWAMWLGGVLPQKYGLPQARQIAEQHLAVLTWVGEPLERRENGHANRGGRRPRLSRASGRGRRPSAEHEIDLL